MTLPRYRRNDPLAALRYLLGTGNRPATSVAEARAAAYIDSRMRRAGLSVSADTFRAPRSLGATYPLLALPALLAAPLGIVWHPLPALLLALYGLILALADMLALPLPALAPLRDSQNIIATRPCVSPDELLPGLPSWRVVLLAPLDTPRKQSGLARLQGRQVPAQVGRVVACGLLVLLLACMLSLPHPAWNYALLLPLAYLLVAALPPSAQSDTNALFGSSGALATVLAAVEQLTGLESVEVWAVALGATSTGDRGMADFLERYPFEQTETLLLVLPHIGEGQLVLASSEGLFRQYPADTLLLDLAASVRPPAEALPTRARFTSATTLTTLLHWRGYRSLTMHTHHDPPATLPDDETMAQLSFQMLEPVKQLLVDMVRRLDAT